MYNPPRRASVRTPRRLEVLVRQRSEGDSREPEINDREERLFFTARGKNPSGVILELGSNAVPVPASGK